MVIESQRHSPAINSSEGSESGMVTLFLCGDVMTGRGIDQILAHPGKPTLHEIYMKDARGYVELAEATSGPIPRKVGPAYIWGDALDELKRAAPRVSIINLETSITTSADFWAGKEVLYRMHPDNIDCISSVGIGVCSLANNHVLDWGYAGLRETLLTLKKAKIQSAGAGMNIREAEAPAIVEFSEKGRVIVFAFGSPTAGVPLSWAATDATPGVNLLKDFSDKSVRGIRGLIDGVRQTGDIVVFSLHWGSNWGYELSSVEVRFAHRLIDEAGVDIVHGHSSHHVKGIEVYQDRLILYGCGDFLNDYEGIGGYEYFRGDLGLMYLASMDPATGKFAGLQMAPTRIRHFKANRASQDEARWLADVLNREGKRLNTTVDVGENNVLTLQWRHQSVAAG
jgi:poly-gamma-glutamate capsule biosynthesis protein CapA/YwtB (metallophosphatase superfamily)